MNINTNQYLALSEVSKEGSVIMISYISGQFHCSLLDKSEDTHIHVKSDTLGKSLSLLDKAALDVIKIRYRNQSLAFLRRMISALNKHYKEDLSLIYKNSTNSIDIIDNTHNVLDTQLKLDDIDQLAFSKYTHSAKAKLNEIITAFLTITSYDNLLDEIRVNDIVFGVTE